MARIKKTRTAQLYDVNVEILNPSQVKDKYPGINNSDLEGGIFMPGDGQADCRSY